MGTENANSATARLEYVDLMRGLAVLCMILVHTQMFYLSTDFYSDLFYKVVDFLGGAPAAPVFLFLMGYVFSLKKDTRWYAVLKRAFQLLFLGYLLNILRQALPNYLWGLHHRPDYIESLLMIDILQMAGPALVLLNLLKRWPSVVLFSLLGVVIFTSSFFWGMTSTPGVLDFLWGKGEWIFFPLLPWFAYCILGMLCWRLEKHFHNWFMFAGLTLMVLGIGLEQLQIWTGPLYTYYRSSPAQLLWMSGFCLVWLKVSQRVLLNISIKKVITFLSQYVTEFYFFSWLWITWLCFYFGYQKMNSLQVFGVFILVLILTGAVIWLWNKGRQKIFN